MPTKKQIQPGEKVPLKLTAAERKLVLEDVTCLDTGYEQIIRDTPSGKPVMMSLDELDDFGGYLAAEATDKFFPCASSSHNRRTCRSLTIAILLPEETCDSLRILNLQ